MGHMEYEKLCRLVEQWNENRLDLFHLSQPTQDLEVEGVMRFYFCDDEGRVCTKCIRVSSTATTQAVIDALVDKFLPDLKMLTDPDYSLWEVHEGGEERSLSAEEKPLLVQLNWHKDDKEGRFLLKKHGMNFLPIQALKDHDQSSNIKRSNKRFSKREKKEDKVKKKHKDIITVHEGIQQENIDATGLYKQVPPTTFTRTISNPEIVMKKRREKRIESKLRDMGHGGSLKVYGEEIVPSRPYVTILVSSKDRTTEILKEALIKYNVREEHWTNFQLVQVEMAQGNERKVESLTDLTTRSTHSRNERVLGEDECPLLHLANAPPDVFLIFVLRRRIGERPTVLTNLDTSSLILRESTNRTGAYLISLSDNSRIALCEGVTEMGSDGNLHLFARHHIRVRGVCSRHCVITVSARVCTITPSSPDAFIMINDRRIDRTETVCDGNLIRFGNDVVFRFRSIAILSTKSPSIVDPAHTTLKTDVRTVDSHGIPLSISIDENGISNLLIEAMSRSTESAPLPLSSSFLIFIGLHSLHDRPSVGIQVMKQLSTHLSHLSNKTEKCRGRLLYWLSNCSHLQYLLSADICFSFPLSELCSLIQSLFHSLVEECTGELSVLLPSFFDPTPTNRRGGALTLLQSILQSCRSAQLNADITIQLASQLFSYLNASIFNQMIGMKCSSSLGEIVSTGLSEIEEWATGVGLELAVECLLDTCRQAANLLMVDKTNLVLLGSTTYKLNSLQIRHLLSSWEPRGDESAVGNDVLHRIIGLAERQADEMCTEEGIPLTLLEINRLNGMEMIQPQEGFFTNQSLSHFEPLKSLLDELAEKGVCSNVKWNEESVGWVTDRLFPPSPSLHSILHSSSLNEPCTTLVKVHLNRGTGGIGLSIVAAQGVGETQCGIYIKKVLDGSVAAKDGRLSAGDELISVNESPLRGLSQEEAARTLFACGPIVRFEVRMGAATKNGLLSYLVSPPPSQMRVNTSPSPSQQYTPFIGRCVGNEPAVAQSSASAFSIPQKNSRSISTSDLFQGNDPNTSFSGRSMASSTTSAFSALPSHYKRPTVIQPTRNMSPSNLRNGAISPSLLSHSLLESSPHSIRQRAISPTPLSHGAVIPLVSSPPLARSSPLPALSFSRSIDSSSSQRMHQFTPGFPPNASMGTVAESVAAVAMNKRKEATERNRYPQSTLIDDVEGNWLQLNRYGGRPMTSIRRETLIDDIADYDLDSPTIVGAQEVYRDPRSKRMADSVNESHSSFDRSKLGFGEKMRFFARGIGESSPPTRVTASSAQRIIQDDL
ncbi:hypothetical protein PMAYCL1PPCAC_23777 [Pristionchus mayeri]|uniref:Afd-1 n=1 Tax=Pristionchus mayeri TaxID=1317129 RepID=A0AAN5CZY6_9BILA|nr:hypothetical protein PMAYCL1PPCAC_23777 [Pristionchus mayeri]